MPTIDVLNMTGAKVSELELSEGIFAIEPNASAMHIAVVNYLANQRQGTQSTLTRAEVSGGGKKPWRQKGTGRARQGSTRSPQWTGGGIVFAPKPRDYSITLNKKERRLAIKSVLTSKVQDNKFFVLDELKLDEIKTRKMKAVLDALKVQKAVIVLPEMDKNVICSAKNLPGVITAQAGSINAYDLLKYDTVVTTKDGVAKIEEVFA